MIDHPKPVNQTHHSQNNLTHMKKTCLLLLLSGLLVLTGAVNTQQEMISYKCLIQLSNYGGEGAYVVASLIDPEGNYERTLLVCGNDEEWYEDLTKWYAFLNESGEKIDGITGASIQSGGRKIAVLRIEASRLNSGYTLRFESAVEDAHYYHRDLEIELNESALGKPIEGTGYIRHVQLIGK